MNEILIRPMMEDDISALCFADGGETPENRECFERYFAWQEQDGDCVFLLAFLDGKLAGHLFVFYHDCPSGAEEVDMPRLADLRVYEPYRGHGVASMLLQEGERLAGTVCNQAFLVVDPDEPILQAYERRGYYHDGEENEDLVMIKQLQ